MVRDDILGAKRAKSGQNELQLTTSISRQKRSPGGKRITLKRTIVAIIIILVAGALFVGGLRVLKDSSAASPSPSSGSASTRTAPDFTPLTPSDNQANNVADTKYDPKRNLVTYTVTFSGARLTVSQQPLPANFAADPNALSRAADSIKAKQRVDTDNGLVYVASNDEGADQMGVFAGEQVLLFVHSDRTLDAATWKAFIEQLQDNVE